MKEKYKLKEWNFSQQKCMTSHNLQIFHAFTALIFHVSRCHGDGIHST